MAKANYDLPNAKIEEVMKLSGAKTKREALVVAIESYLKRKRLESLLSAPGKVSLTWTRKALKAYRD